MEVIKYCNENREAIRAYAEDRGQIAAIKALRGMFDADGNRRQQAADEFLGTPPTDHNFLSLVDAKNLIDLVRPPKAATLGDLLRNKINAS